MIIASTFNKGGVGKTTLAVHVIGVLNRKPTARNLLVDCVDQADAFKFFVRERPTHAPQFKQISDNLAVIFNPDRLPLARIISLDEYDNVVIDINSPAEETVQIIADNFPDRVLMPINDQALGMDALQTTLEVIAGMELRAGYKIRSTIVPLGVDAEVIREKIAALDHLPAHLTLSAPIGNHRTEFSNALTNGQFAWEVDSHLSYVHELLAQTLFNRDDHGH